MFLGFVAPGWFRLEASLGEGEPVSRKPDDSGTDRQQDKEKDKSTPNKKDPVSPKDADADVLTVSQKPEGKGKYRTIADALFEVKAGQTIRVLDSASYGNIVAF